MSVKHYRLRRAKVVLAVQQHSKVIARGVQMNDTGMLDVYSENATILSVHHARQHARIGKWAGGHTRKVVPLTVEQVQAAT